MKDKIFIDVGVKSSSQLSDLSKRYNNIRNSDSTLGVSYEKQSKIVSLFSKKWYEACCKEYVVLDFETTGLDKVYDKIIEVAAIRYINGKETEKFITLINPKMPIPPEVTKINHISNSMVASAPDESIVIPRLIQFLGNSLLVGHNVNFDIGMLEIAAQRHGLNVQYNYIDTISVSKKLFPNLTNYKLGTVAKALNIDKRRLHRAEADVRVCADIISIAVNTLSSDFDNISKELKNRKSVKSSDMQNKVLQSVQRVPSELNNPIVKRSVIMYCPNCGKEITPAKFCPECGAPVANQAKASPAQHKPKAGNSKKKKKKSKTGCLVAFIIAVIAVALILIIAILGGGDETTATTDSGNTSNSISEKTEEKANPVIYEDDYIKASFIKVYSDKNVDSIVEGVAYLQLHVENKSSQTYTVSLSNAAINGMSTTIGSGVPMTILPGNSSEQPFILFTKNTGVTNADDIEKVQFSFYLLDENLNNLEETKTITVNVK